MDLKKQLVKFLETFGTKGRTYVEIYNMFPVKGKLTNKQASDYVRGILNTLKRKHEQLQYELTLDPIVEASYEEKKGPKILVFDIETSPLKAFVWRLWKQNVHPMSGQLQNDFFIITWAAKWLFEEEVFSDKMTKKEVLQEDDSRVVKSLWKMIDEADVIIGHNIISFDIKKMNTRFLAHGLGLPSHCQTIDTYKHAKKTLAMTSNKLDYIAKFLGLTQKLSTTFELWEQCVKGNKKALKRMEKYNRGDIKTSEEVYLKLRPYIKPHPNLGLFLEDNIKRCPTCLSEELKITSSYRTSTNVYDCVKCTDCQSISRSRANKTSKDFRKSLILSTNK